jgi:hypothetical protein
VELAAKAIMVQLVYLHLITEAAVVAALVLLVQAEAQVVLVVMVHQLIHLGVLQQQLVKMYQEQFITQAAVQARITTAAHQELLV